MERMVGDGFPPDPAPESLKIRAVANSMHCAHTIQHAAFCLAKRCLKDAERRTASHPAAQHFSADSYKVLQDRLGLKGEPGLTSQIPQRSMSPILPQHHSDSHCTDSPDAAGSVDNRSSQIKTPMQRQHVLNEICSRLFGKLSGSSMKTARMLKALPGRASSLSKGGESEADDGSQLQSMQALEVLAAAAPVSSEARHWAWLLRWVSQGCSSAPAAALRMRYLASAAPYLEHDYDSMGLLLAELQWAASERPPVNRQLFPDVGCLSAAPLSGCTKEVQEVAACATNMAHAVVLGYRANCETKAANANLLAIAVQLIPVAASHAPGSAGLAAAAAEADEHLTGIMYSAAQQRYTLLCNKFEGSSSSRGATKAASLIPVVGQLVDDVQDDVEHYHEALPRVGLILPEISVRAYCELLRRDLASVCVPIDGTLVELVAAVHKMELLAVKWCPAGRGQALLTDASGSPLFLGHVKRWCRAAMDRLQALGEGLQKQAQKPWAELGSSSGSRQSNQQSPRHTRSLQEFCEALYSVVTEGLPVMTSHPEYAALVEHALSRAVLTYAAGLERRQLQPREQQQCEGGGGGGGGEHLTATAEDTPCFGGRPDAATVSLCHDLNDLREIRARLLEIAEALKLRLPSDWWGRSASGSRSDSGCRLGSSSGTSLLQEGRVKANIGDRFRLCQCEIERKYVSVLHRYVRSVSGPLAACILDVIAAAGPDDEGSSPSAGAGRGGVGLGGGGDGASPGAVPAEVSFRLQPAANHLDRLLEELALVLDGRVLKRLTKELWNTAAGMLQDRALSNLDNPASAGSGGDGSPCSLGGLGSSGGGTGSNLFYKSIDTVGPRVRAVDAALRWFAAYFTAGYGGCGCGGGLRRGDEPDKAKELTRWLAFFLREDATESFDGLVCQ